MIGFIILVLLFIIIGAVIFYFIPKVNDKDGYQKGEDKWY